MRTWACSFEYDATNDVVFAYPCGRLCTPEAAAEAYTEIGSHYAAYGRKIDVIVLIDMWSVDDHVDHRESRMWLMSHVRNMVVVSHDTTSTGRMADRLDDDTPSFGEAHDVATALRMIRESRAKDVRFAG